MAVIEKLQEFSIDDLLTELRARERQKKGGAADGTAAARPQPINDALKEWDTATIATTLKEKQKVIYGVDDRQDLYQITDQANLADADSVVALFHSGNIADKGDGTSSLQTQNFGTAMNLCSSEPFRNQPIGAFCTGFLVAQDIIATAGHCVDSTNVKNIRFVFGFRMLNATTAQKTISNSEIYKGVSVIGRQENGNGPDWTLVRIDRPVPNHRIAPIRREGKIGNNQAVHIIGHPAGLPVKFAAGAQVRDNKPSGYFVANLDSYGGNSGSPVFNRETHEVEGILVRGETDFADSGTCQVSMVCPTTGCRGEDVTRATEFANLVPVLRSPRVPAKAEVSVVSCSKDKLDIFVTDKDEVIRTAAWEPVFTHGWRAWWEINGGRAASGAPVRAVSRSTDKLDMFVTGTDNHVYAAAWEPSMGASYGGWWEVADGVAGPRAHVTVVSRSKDKLDAFVVGTDGGVYTASWEPAFTDGWRGWRPIGNIRVPAGTPVHAVSRSADKLDIFVTDKNGVILTASWEPAFTDGWHAWREINGGRAAAGTPVTAVSRSKHKLDIFVVGTDNNVWSAAWEPNPKSEWFGWFSIGKVRMPTGAPVYAVSRSTDKLDIFATDTNGAIVTASWEPAFTDGWHGWRGINGGQAAPGAPVTAVSRSTDKLDIFVIGTDGRVWSAAWEANAKNDWFGWFPIGI